MQEEEQPIYDASARNRFEFTVTDNGEKYDVAHVFGPVTDERYMQWNRDLNVRGDGEEVQEDAREASARLWDDVIDHVENVEFESEEDWKSLIPSSEKVDALNELLAVAIVEKETDGKGPRRLGGGVSDTQTIITEAWFNGVAVQQTHVLARKTIELEKRFERIQNKRFKTEQTKGLRRKPRIEFVPQDDKLGQLYDDMCRSVTGFAGILPDVGGYVIPLRFKTLVVNYIFSPSLDQKTVGKSQNSSANVSSHSPARSSEDQSTQAAQEQDA